MEINIKICPFCAVGHAAEDLPEMKLVSPEGHRESYECETHGVMGAKQISDTWWSHPDLARYHA